MSKHKSKVNPHCPVPGCRAAVPHADDPLVKGLILAFAPPEEMTRFACAAISELCDSIRRDWMEGKVFSWYSRLRQPEELYIRTLYALFIANEKELHHVISGDTPNGIAVLYDKVNEVIFEGRGLQTTSKPGLNFGTFKPMETLHQGAHTSFAAFLTSISIVRHPEYLPPGLADKYHEHLKKYCVYLNYMHGMFKAGKSRQDVLAGVKNLHKA
jgi:hypothetical protein